MSLQERISTIDQNSGNCWHTALFIAGLAPYGNRMDMDEAKAILEDKTSSTESPSIGDVVVFGQVDNGNFEHMAVVTGLNGSVKITHRYHYQGRFEVGHDIETFRREQGYENSSLTYYRPKIPSSN